MLIFNTVESLARSGNVGPLALPGAGRTMRIWSEAAGVVDPARESASISVMSPLSV